MLVDFANLTPPDKPNYYLVCPRNYCHVKPNAYSPVYDVGVEALEKIVTQYILSRPRTKALESDAEKNQYIYVQRSLIFRFPDYISVEYLSLDSHKSTLAIYSRSKYGYSDFGVNKRRVQKWLKGIDHLALSKAQRAEGSHHEMNI